MFALARYAYMLGEKGNIQPANRLCVMHALLYALRRFLHCSILSKQR